MVRGEKDTGNIGGGGARLIPGPDSKQSPEGASQTRLPPPPPDLATPTPGPDLQGDHHGVRMSLDMSAALAALGLHKLLQLRDLLVQAVDVLLGERSSLRRGGGGAVHCSEGTL